MPDTKDDDILVCPECGCLATVKEAEALATLISGISQCPRCDCAFDWSAEYHGVVTHTRAQIND